jgi:hypothetical protein
MSNVSLAEFAPLAILLSVSAPYVAIAALIVVFEVVVHDLLSM